MAKGIVVNRAEGKICQTATISAARRRGGIASARDAKLRAIEAKCRLRMVRSTRGAVRAEQRGERHLTFLRPDV